MATRKTVTTVEEQAPQDVEVIEVDEVEEAAETALDGLLAEFSGADDVVVNVYRQGEGKNISFLFKTMPEEMNGGDIMERCRDQFGTGDYRLHVRKGARILANRSFSVEAPAQPEPPPQAQQLGPADLIAMMTKQNESMQTMFMGVMQSMAEAFRGRNENAPAPVDPIAQQAAILEGIAAMKKLADGDDKGPSGVEMLIRGLELAKDMAPKTGDTNVMDLASKFVDAFPVLTKAAGAGQPAMMPRPNTQHPMMPGPDVRQPIQPGAPTGQPIQPGAPTGHVNPPVEVDGQKGQSPQPDPQNVVSEQDKETEAFFMKAKANLQWLCRLAQQNKSPELYAEVVLDQMGEAAVMDFIGKDNALELLGQVEPAVTLYPGWFEALKSAILEMVGEEKDEPEGEPISDGMPNPETVVARIDESGLRREERRGATVNVPEIPTVERPENGTVVAIGSDGESASDT